MVLPVRAQLDMLNFIQPKSFKLTSDQVFCFFSYGLNIFQIVCLNTQSFLDIFHPAKPALSICDPVDHLHLQVEVQVAPYGHLPIPIGSLGQYITCMY